MIDQSNLCILSHHVLSVCIVVLDRHLVVCLVLVALVICVGYMCSGVIGAHLMQEGSGPCKIPISYGVRDM